MDKAERKALARIGVEIEEEPRYQNRQIVHFVEPESDKFDVLRKMNERMTTHGVAEHFPGYWILFGSREKTLRHLDKIVRKHFGMTLSEIGSLEQVEV